MFLPLPLHPAQNHHPPQQRSGGKLRQGAAVTQHRGKGMDPCPQAPMAQRKGRGTKSKGTISLPRPPQKNLHPPQTKSAGPCGCEGIRGGGLHSPSQPVDALVAVGYVQEEVFLMVLLWREEEEGVVGLWGVVSPSGNPPRQSQTPQKLDPAPPCSLASPTPHDTPSPCPSVLQPLLPSLAPATLPRTPPT